MISCDEEDDDEQNEEYNGKTTNDKESNKVDSIAPFAYSQASIEAMVNKCKKTQVFNDGNGKLFAYYSNALNVFEYENNKLAYVVNCKNYGDSLKAQIAYNDLNAPLFTYITAKLSGNYVVVKSNDPKDLDNYHNLTISQLEAYIPIYIKNQESGKTEEVFGDNTDLKLTPAEASTLCKNNGDVVVCGKSLIYANLNKVLTSFHYSNDSLVSISTYQDYQTEERVNAALEDALSNKRDEGEWTTNGTYLVLSTTDKKVLERYSNMSNDELAEFLKNNKQ